jgi:hypothetical protein
MAREQRSSCGPIERGGGGGNSEDAEKVRGLRNECANLDGSQAYNSVWLTLLRGWYASGLLHLVAVEGFFDALHGLVQVDPCDQRQLSCQPSLGICQPCGL